MSYFNGPPKIVTDGLVLMLDPIISKGYPGSGNTIYDLSGRGNNGTINGATYWSDGKGCFHFDGVDDYINIGTVSTYFPGPTISAAVDVWIRPNSINERKVYFGIQSPTDNRLYAGNYDGFWDVGFGSYYWGSGFTGTKASVSLSWTHLCLNITSGTAKLYINSTETITKTTDTSVSMTDNFYIGAYFFNGSFGTADTGSSQITNFKIYNRPLTAQEINQNYNSTKYRFGL